MNLTQRAAWMAGVLETRGKIRFTNGADRKTNQLVLQVQSQHLGVIAKLCEATGGQVRDRPGHVIEATRRPCTEHCSDRHSHVVAELPDTALWSISGVGAAIVLHNLLPYITNDAGLQSIVDNILAQLPKAGRGRPAVDQAIIRLRRLGWKIPPQALEHFVGTPVKRGERGRFAKAPQGA